MSKAMHRKKPSAEINVQALVVSFEETGNPFDNDGGSLLSLDSKVTVDAAAMTAVSPVITSGIQQYNNFVEERLEKRTKPVKKPLRKNKLACVCATTEGWEIFPDNPSATAARIFAALHCMPDKGREPARIFSGTKSSQTPPSLSKLGDMRTGKKADLQKCLERSPLGSGNADEEEVLVDETNNTD